MLFSRQILNGSQDLNTLIFIYFLKYITIETNVRAFLTLIILFIAGVCKQRTAVDSSKTNHLFLELIPDDCLTTA